MKYENFFKYMFESKPDYRKVVLKMFLNQNDKSLLHEIGFSAHDVIRLNLDFTNLFIEQHKSIWSISKTKKNPLLRNFQINKWKLTSLRFLKIQDMNEVLFCY